MSIKATFIKTAGAATIALLALTGAAAAEDREFTYSITVGGTSDYVFRGLSNNSEDPAAQASFDIGYGIFYAGVWGSNVDYPGVASAEVDVYAGIKPVWGPATFDFAVLYYAFPGADNDDADYVEFKAGVGFTPVTNLATNVNFYYSPENQFATGNVWTVEGTVGYTFPAVGIFTPTLSGTYGYQQGEDQEYVDLAAAFGEDNYSYWNVGLALAVEKFTFDFRYWGTDLDNAGGCEEFAAFNCDDRFVFSAKVTLP